MRSGTDGAITSELLEAPLPGAICILSRDGDPSAGHVGFYLGRTETKLALLGGNQNDAVTVALFDAGRLLGFRWPPAAGAEQTKPPVVEGGVFERALAHVLQMEGGYSYDPYDPGGPTNRGITLETFAKWRSETINAASRARIIDDLKRIPDETVAAIYRARYWQPALCAELPGPVALMHFDAAVNHGVGGAIRLLQTAAGAGVDGEIGPETLAAVRRMPLSDVLNQYADLRRKRYRALPHFWRFGRGWLNRVDATLRLAETWAREGDLQTEQPIAQANGDDAMTKDQAPQIGVSENTGKWWAQSKTVWGAIIAAAATVIPAFGPLIGVDLPADVIRDAGEQTVSTVQAVVGLIGTLLTIYGRLTAAGPLTRRTLNVRL